MQSKGFRWLIAAALLASLAGCGGGPVKRVSKPAASIQQLTVRADGGWDVDVRIDNYSSVEMHVQEVSLALTVAGESAGTLSRAGGDFSIGPESADVETFKLSPTSAAKITVADALAGRKTVAYALKGTMNATFQDAGQRNFEIDATNSLDPAPGLPGVLR
ncbi:hypothetical protein LVB87_15500 [Lysobacter sp. KIS68-7]|uniref:hypothetical protein n=1 Tax=Lysobacter sp. KIS68-7 TaxID=2904252 RepID=UPI001E46ADFE|nr:hypothetical protein [Lysobacter sp. KIS68-7]UHQ19571.1 hypothetical protein LVB87_15500 [Lysobacter sp. KIS68-7]